MAEAITICMESDVSLPNGETVWFFVNDNNEPYGVTTGYKFGWEDCIKNAPVGLLMEFGVRGGGTMREIAAATDRTVYGFDWWKGLPHEWDNVSPKGACLAAKPTDLPDHVVLVEGLFSDTLEEFLLAHPEQVGFVNLDCDLYCSTLYVLHCLKERFVTGSIVAFSAMTHFVTLSQKKAWSRYLSEGSEVWQYMGKQHVWGEVYKKV